MNPIEKNEFRKGRANRPLMVEFIGTSGVGKSFVYNAFKSIHSSDPDYKFMEKSDYDLFQLFNVNILISTFIDIFRCNLPDREHFYKYFKMCYFTRVLMKKGSKSTGKFVIIDEGPLHRARAIRKYSKLDSRRVRRILLNRRSVISDIVIYLDANPEKIHQRRQSRGTRAMETSIQEIINEIEDEKKGSNEDIEYIHENVKEIKMIMIANDDNDVMSTLESINKIINKI